MSNLSLDQNLKFDDRMVLTAPWDGTPQYLGTLRNKPVLMMIKNQSDASVFFADNSGTTAGTTMVAGEEIILDCRANHGFASNMGFGIGTSFYITGELDSGGTDIFEISILYAT